MTSLSEVRSQLQSLIVEVDDGRAQLMELQVMKEMLVEEMRSGNFSEDVWSSYLEADRKLDTERARVRLSVMSLDRVIKKERELCSQTGQVTDVNAKDIRWNNLYVCRDAILGAIIFGGSDSPVLGIETGESYGVGIRMGGTGTVRLEGAGGLDASNSQIHCNGRVRVENAGLQSVETDELMVGGDVSVKQDMHVNEGARADVVVARENIKCEKAMVVGEELTAQEAVVDTVVIKGGETVTNSGTQLGGPYVQMRAGGWCPLQEAIIELGVEGPRVRFNDTSPGFEVLFPGSDIVSRLTLSDQQSALPTWGATRVPQSNELRSMSGIVQAPSQTILGTIDTANLASGGGVQVNGQLVCSALEVDGRVVVDGDDVIPAGSIVMWNNSVAPHGWVLCDGENGTPDLRGRFVKAGKVAAPGLAAGSSASKQLGIEHLPGHDHGGQGVTTANGGHDHTGQTSGPTHPSRPDPTVVESLASGSHSHTMAQGLGTIELEDATVLIRGTFKGSAFVAATAALPDDEQGASVSAPSRSDTGEWNTFAMQHNHQVEQGGEHDHTVNWRHDHGSSLTFSGGHTHEVQVPYAGHAEPEAIVIEPRFVTLNFIMKL